MVKVGYHDVVCAGMTGSCNSLVDKHFPYECDVLLKFNVCRLGSVQFLVTFHQVMNYTIRINTDIKTFTELHVLRLITRAHDFIRYGAELHGKHPFSKKHIVDSELQLQTF